MKRYFYQSPKFNRQHKGIELNYTWSYKIYKEEYFYFAILLIEDDISKIKYKKICSTKQEAHKWSKLIAINAPNYIEKEEKII